MQCKDNSAALVVAVYGQNDLRMKVTTEAMFKIVEIQKVLPKIYFCELMFNDDVTDYPEIIANEHVTHIRVRGNEENRDLFQKECLYNFVISKTREEHLIFIDGDVYSDDPYWLAKIIGILKNDRFAVCHVFKRCIDNGEEEWHDGVGFGYNRCVVHREEWTMPGIGWAVNRHLLAINDGFNPWCITGSGDIAFMNEYIGEPIAGLEERSFRWFRRIIRRNLTKGNVCYANSDLIHIHHGKHSERAYYWSRAVVDWFGDVTKFVYIDEGGLLAWYDQECVLRRIVSDKKAISGNKDKICEIISKTIDIPHCEVSGEQSILQETALITTWFGRHEVNLRAAKLGLPEIMSQNPMPHVFFIELITDGGETSWPEVDDDDRITHVIVRGDDSNNGIFQKEALFQIAMKHVDKEKYRYLLFHDIDCYSVDPKWAEKLLSMMRDWLDRNPGKNNVMIQTHRGVYDTVDDDYRPSYAYLKETGDRNIQSGQGMSWLVCRDFWEECGGWVTEALHGQNDGITIAKLESERVHTRFHKKDNLWHWKGEIFTRFDNSDHLRADILCYPEDLCHVYHGCRSRRGYSLRTRLLTFFARKATDVAHIDKNGLIAWNNKESVLARISRIQRNEIPDQVTLSSKLSEMIVEYGFNWVCPDVVFSLSGADFRRRIEDVGVDVSSSSYDKLENPSFTDIVNVFRYSHKEEIEFQTAVVSGDSSWSEVMTLHKNMVDVVRNSSSPLFFVKAEQPKDDLGPVWWIMNHLCNNKAVVVAVNEMYDGEEGIFITSPGLPNAFLCQMKGDRWPELLKLFDFSKITK